jgi:glycosyltransferase involved in cell wall biosynthesis
MEQGNLAKIKMKTKKNLNPLISVIVPVYNTEEYLPASIHSILTQTYSNIEIIAVNDGSSDSSLKILKRYAKQDKRIVIINKNNTGASDSRNKAIEIIRGKFVMFVDSDDIIEPEIIQILYSNGQKYNAQISTCGLNKYYPGGKISKTSKSESIFIYNNSEALEKMLFCRGIDNGPVAKLFNSELFKDIRFVKGTVATDLGTLYKIISIATTIVVSTFNGYHYFQRPNSIIHSSFTPKRMIGLHFARQQYAYIRIFHPDIENAAIDRLFVEALNILTIIPLNSSKFKEQQRECFNVVSRYRATIVTTKGYRYQTKIYALVSFLGCSTFVIFCRIKNRIWRHLP